MDGAVVLGTGTLNGSGVATLKASTLAVGTHPVVASYGGDSKSASSSSTAVSVTVSPATVSTTTVLNGSPLSLPAGNTVTLVAEYAAGIGFECTHGDGDVL